MGVIARIAEYHGEMTEWRRDIHAHPELGFEERRTADLVAQKLAAFGYEVFRGIGKTGVVGRLRAGNSEHSIGLRADMDCLPIEEATNLPYARNTRAACTPAAMTGTRRCCWVRHAISPRPAISTAPFT